MARTIVIVAVVMSTACGGGSPSRAPAEHSATVTRDQFGAAWPLTVDEGTIHCEGSEGFGEVTFEADGVTYAVNGLPGPSKPDIRRIWADDPANPGTKLDIGPIVDRGLELCS